MQQKQISLNGILQALICTVPHSEIVSEHSLLKKTLTVAVTWCFLCIYLDPLGQFSMLMLHELKYMILFPPCPLRMEQDGHCVTGFGDACRMGAQGPNPQPNGLQRHHCSISDHPFSRSVKLSNQEWGSDEWQGKPVAASPQHGSRLPGRDQPDLAYRQGINGADPRYAHLELIVSFFGFAATWKN